MSATQPNPQMSPTPPTVKVHTEQTRPENGKLPHKSRRKQGTSIQLQHILLMVLIFLPLIAIQIYSAFTEYETQRRTVLEGQLATARSVNRTMTAFINDQVANNRALSFNFDGSQKLTTEQGNAILARFRSSSGLIHTYRFLNLEGQALYADPPALVGFNSSQEPFFKQILTGADYVVSDLRLSNLDNTTPTFAVANAVRDPNGRLVGVLMASINTNMLGQVLDIKLGQRGRGSLSIHDRQAHLIYNSQFPTMTYERRITNAVSPSVKVALEGQETVQEYIISALDGLEKMGASTPIRSVGWSASVAEPIEDAMSSAMQLIVSRSILFGIVVLIAGVAAWFYSRYLTRPIFDLSKAAVVFGQGQLDYRAPITTRTTELAQLGLSFNQMADKIAEDTRSKDVFLSQVAHELKTPVTVIKGSTQLLINRQQKELSAIASEAAENQASLVQRQNQIKTLYNVEHQTNRMVGLINRLLELSRYQTGQLQYQLEIVNFSELTTQCVEAARQLTTPDRHSIELIIENDAKDKAASQEWQIMGDVARLEQVILNLLENAIKYSPEGGPIEVSLCYQPMGKIVSVPGLELKIKDSGLGLENTDLDHLFERYYRANNGGTNIGGLGLGLYISYEIVRQHNGRLWADSPGLGQGSTFHLVLPLRAV